jgi:hypothetical protein
LNEEEKILAMGEVVKFHEELAAKLEKDGLAVKVRFKDGSESTIDLKGPILSIIGAELGMTLYQIETLNDRRDLDKVPELVSKEIKYVLTRGW